METRGTASGFELNDGVAIICCADRSRGRTLSCVSEPARLHLMNALREQERTVGELVDLTALGTANVSKHLQILYAAGFVTRRKEGLFVYYRLAGAHVFRLCDLMCEQIEAEVYQRQDVFALPRLGKKHA